MRPPGGATRVVVRGLFAPRHATARLLLGAFAISFSAVFVRAVDVAPTVSAVWRVLLGGAILALWLAARGRWRRIAPGALLPVALGGVFFALDLAVWHQSILYVGPGLATLLGNFQVFFMALAGALVFRERLSGATLLAIPVAFAGLSLITGFEWSALDAPTRRGIALGLLTAVFYSAFMLSMRWAQRRAPHPDAGGDLAIACLVSAAVLVALAAAQGDGFAVPAPRDLVLLVCYALIAQVVGWLLITSALAQVPVSRVGLALLLQPALAFVWDVWFFERAFTAMEGAGAALALAAIWLGARPAR